jgi:methionine aminotransferase
VRAYDGISDLSESEFAQWLTREIKVAAIPVSAFYSQGKESGIVRFCFAKQDETLKVALERLGEGESLTSPRRPAQAGSKLTRV